MECVVKFQQANTHMIDHDSNMLPVANLYFSNEEMKGWEKKKSPSECHPNFFFLLWSNKWTLSKTLQEEKYIWHRGGPPAGCSKGLWTSDGVALPSDLDFWAFADFMRSFRPQQRVARDHWGHTTHQQRSTGESFARMFDCEDQTTLMSYFFFWSQTPTWPCLTLKDFFKKIYNNNKN